MAKVHELVNQIAIALGHAHSVPEEQIKEVNSLADWWAVAHHGYMMADRFAAENNLPGPTSFWDITTSERTTVSHTTGTGRMIIRATEKLFEHTDDGVITMEIWAGGKTPAQITKLLFTVYGLEGDVGLDVLGLSSVLLEGRLDRLGLLTDVLGRVPILQETIEAWGEDLQLLDTDTIAFLNFLRKLKEKTTEEEHSATNET